MPVVRRRPVVADWLVGRWRRQTSEMASTATLTRKLVSRRRREKPLANGKRVGERDRGWKTRKTPVFDEPTLLSSSRYHGQNRINRALVISLLTDRQCCTGGNDEKLPDALRSTALLVSIADYEKPRRFVSNGNGAF